MPTETQRPVVVVIAGPNGAGKTTVALQLLAERGALEFVNADMIAAELAPGEVETVAIEAGRRMLARMAQLRDKQQSFALETTLSLKTLPRFLDGCRSVGYEVELIFVWVRSADLSVARVAKRVARGGHHIPEEVIRRRYSRGIDNFLRVYRTIVNRWVLCDNSGEVPFVIAHGENRGSSMKTTILNEAAYEKFQRATTEPEPGS